ncbi:hypothetical protein CFN78_08170 [Amycolatopsis antarctica]|uniref:DUF4185 domain-containing protein n=1 Tax=Amycolatopsis antarctica TaxID=1854586 RepID=A0A263D8G8_9PSEU|nr:DUF4185 domain-containing protein [Amycolatopsis antarctica]OZM73776.1 hypothetical protein CFN78_08170 [Amycolatopsis antarctica]
MVRVIETTRVGRVTGAGSAGRTDERFGIHATDLGIMWDGGDGRVFVLFGDTYGPGWGGHGGGPDHADWRCNVLAFTSERQDLSGGLVLDAVVPGADGLATQVIARDPGRRDEATVIPNAGIAVDGTQYVQYMSVKQWGRPGHWTTNYAGIAVSGDGGVTWAKPERACWINRAERDHPFQIGAFTRDEDHVYLLGTTNGRFGDAHLARVDPGSVADARAYTYWTGNGWVRDEFLAAPVFSGPVGELSVAYNVHFGQWMAMHLDEARGAIVLRMAERLHGPWTEGQVVVSGAEYPALYGGYLHPWFSEGTDLCFLLSQWGPYNVFLMRSRLSG